MSKTIRIAHLYYNLMNLYGENGNVRILAGQLSRQGYQVEVHYLTSQDQLELADYQLLYIGAGTEQNQAIALAHLINYKDQLQTYIEAGGFVLATGNAMELFGQKIISASGVETEMLGFFPYYSLHGGRRIIGEVLGKCLLPKSLRAKESCLSRDASYNMDNHNEIEPETSLLKIYDDKSYQNILGRLGQEPIIGVQNQFSSYHNLTEPIFFLAQGQAGSMDAHQTDLERDGSSSKEQDSTGPEGHIYKNFYATSILGPLLVRNPQFLAYLLSQLNISHEKKLTQSSDSVSSMVSSLFDFDLESEYAAYNHFRQKYL